MATRFLALAAAAFWAVAGAPSASAQSRSNEPGRFDFYVLALSWSPSYCEDGGMRADQEQCGTGRPYAFVVHGLWPQRERDWPEYCDSAERGLPGELAASMLPLMPSRDLIRQQWRKHGVCSGLSPKGYFDLVRQARGRVTVPAAYERLSRPLRTSPGAVEAAFIAANPGLSDEDIAVICRGNRMSEVRVCLGKDLSFRNCPEVDRRACPRAEIVLPPVRGGS
jgi:ribonuclease T2